MRNCRFGLLMTTTLALTVPLFSIHAKAEESLLERGTYLVQTVAACGNCHTPKEGPLQGQELAGGFKIEFPAFAAYASNITPDQETGVGAWSDEQLITAIREGKRPDGSIIGPPMPIALYRQLSDRDVHAIVAYLRTVKPVQNVVPKSEYKFPLPPAYGPSVGSVADVPNSDPVRYGEYLAGPVAHCVECHTPFVQGHPDFANQLGHGGFEFPGPWGVSISRNITNDAEKGLGAWTDDQIRIAITQGLRPDGNALLPPMPFYAYRAIKDEDLNAIIAYLRTLR